MLQKRLTKAEKQRLLDNAVQEKNRRRAANRKAHLSRIAQGRRRIEKTVPLQYLADLRQIVSAVLVEIDAGREPRLRPTEAMSPTDPVVPVGVEKPRSPAAPPPGTRGLGPAGRKRAQTARRRERQRDAGLTRTIFDVPVALVPRISALVDQLVEWMAEGSQVVLEGGPNSKDAVPPDPTLAPNPCPTVVTKILDDLVKFDVDRSDRETSPLFDDIQALGRLEWGAEQPDTGIKQ